MEDHPSPMSVRSESAEVTFYCHGVVRRPGSEEKLDDELGKSRALVLPSAGLAAMQPGYGHGYIELQ